MQIKLFGIVALVLGLAACASTPPQIEYAADNFDATAMDKVVLLSVVDHRVDKSKEVKLDKWVEPFAKKRLKKAGYEYEIDTAPAYVEAVTLDGLEDADAEMIASLGPDGSRWVMLLVLQDASSKMTFGSTGAAEMTGYIFDRETNTIAWRNKEFAEFSQGGLMGMAMKGAMQRSAIELATDKILKGLPKKEDD